MIQRRLELEQALSEAVRRSQWRHRQRLEAYVDAFSRQTVYMESVAKIIEQLGPTYWHLGDLWFQNRQGLWQHIEHIVVGPKGIFFIDTVEADQEPDWQMNWQQLHQYLTRQLGAYHKQLYPIIIDRGATPISQPAGTVVISSPSDLITTIEDGFADELDSWQIREIAALLERSFEAIPSAGALLTEAIRPMGRFAQLVRTRGDLLLTALQFLLWLTATIAVARDKAEPLGVSDFVVVALLTGVAYLLGNWLRKSHRFRALTVGIWVSLVMFLIMLSA